MQRHDDKQAQVIPIVLRLCDWKGAPFARLQVLHCNGKAITFRPNRDEAFTEVVKEIRAFLEGKQPMISPTSTSENASSTYSVHINEEIGIVISNNAQVTQNFSKP